MPIPRPRENEGQNEFISRCMSNEVMKREYPAVKQRVAICYSAWRKKRR